MDFVKPPDVRFRVENVEGVEQIVIPSGRRWFGLVFMGVWIAFWSFGGVMAIREFLRTGEAFLALWLMGWAIGWIFVALCIAWQLTGVEILRVRHGALEHRWRLIGFERGKRYELSHIGTVAPSSAPSPFGRMPVTMPPFVPLRQGVVRFDYGARTIYAASGLSEAEGEMIVDRLRTMLPARMRAG